MRPNLRLSIDTRLNFQHSMLSQNDGQSRKHEKGSKSAPVSPVKPSKRFHINKDHLAHALENACENNNDTEQLAPRRRSFSDVTVDASHLPKLQPGSPACKALAHGGNFNYKDKRIRFGAKKLGKTKYNSQSKSNSTRPEGNEINANHEQYALTYGMMSGILNSAGNQNQFKQYLTMNDFMRVDKRNFQSSTRLQHPFKFKDYSPDIFRQIRRRFNIDNADYMLTLCGDFNYIEFMSNSKSGQFFFYSHDGRFMIKTQTKDESKFLRRIMPHYYKFVMENPNTLLTRFYGMHRVKMHHLRRKMHFIIMASVFDTPKPIHYRFDLKGSLVGREATEKEKASNGVLKDVDMVNGTRKVSLGPDRRARVMEQLRKDVAFLKQMKIMDYSLLIGIHDGTKAEQDEADAPNSSSNSSYGDQANRNAAEEIRHATSTASTTSDSTLTPKSLPTSPPFPYQRSEFLGSDRTHNSDQDDSTDEEADADISPLSPRLLDTSHLEMSNEFEFYKEHGGMIGKTASGKPNNRVYFLGIIDVLQQYNGRKRAETFIKGFRHNRKQISAVNPNLYGDRFLEFMEKKVLIDDKE